MLLELLRPATVQEIEEKQHQEQHSTTKENSVCENSTSVHTDASGGGPRKIDKHDLWTSIARGFDSSSNSTEEAKSREGKEEEEEEEEKFQYQNSPQSLSTPKFSAL